MSAWERRLDWPLTGLAVAFLVMYAVEVLDTTLSGSQRDLLDLMQAVIWAVFVADYLVRLVLASDRRQFLRTHLLDLAVLVLPMARPLRVLRVLTLLGPLNKRLRGGLRGKTAIYVVVTTVLVGLIAALAELDAERDAPRATIKTFGDAAWWALSTITTVGYGDLYPTTAIGRIVASTLMIGGIALLGMITGSFATWFVAGLQDVEQEFEHSGDQLTQRLDELLAEIRALSARTSALESHMIDLTFRHRNGSPGWPRCLSLPPNSLPPKKVGKDTPSSTSIPTHRPPPCLYPRANHGPRAQPPGCTGSVGSVGTGPRKVDAALTFFPRRTAAAGRDQHGSRSAPE